MLIEMSCINEVYLSLYCNLWVGALDAGEMLLILCLYMHVYIYICLSVSLTLSSSSSIYHLITNKY